MTLAIIMLTMSLVLVYQGLCTSGILPFSMLVLDKFSSNNFLLIVRSILSRYSLLLGVLGLALGIFLILSRRQNKEVNTSLSYWGIAVIYFLFNIFILV